MPRPLPHSRTRTGLLRALLVALGACLLLVAGTQAQGEEPPPRAAPQAPAPHGQLRVVHAWVNVPYVDVLVDGAPFGAAIAFGADTRYVPLPEGSHTVVVSAGAGPAAPLLSAEVAIAAGAARTLVASSGLGRALVLDDLTLAPVGGPALVRFVHAADGLPALELAAAEGPRLAGPVELGTASAYVEVPPSAFTLIARLAADDTPVAAIPGAVLVADRSYTFIALGGAGGPLSLLGLIDD